MDSTNTVCPVCTLYLRPGITLKQHLTSHPKQKVIEALVKLAGVDEPSKSHSIPSVPNFSPQINSYTSSSNATLANQPWGQPAPVHLGAPNNVPGGNHVFIYQQSMSTSSPQGNVLQVNPMSQPYVYHPAIFNPPMMPYVYQQQQVILSSNSVHPQIRALPLELQNGENSTEKTTIEEANAENENNEKPLTPEVEKDSNENEVLLIEDNEPEEPSLPKKELEHLHHEHQIKSMEDFENEREEHNDVPPESYLDSEEECYDSDNQDRGDLVASPCSLDADWKDDSELSKACQTQNATPHTPSSEIVDREHLEAHHGDYVSIQEPEYIYCGQYEENLEPCEKYMVPFRPKMAGDSENKGQTSVIPYSQEPIVSTPYTTAKETERYEQSEPIYTSANILHGNDNLDFVSLDDIVIIGDFNTNPVASQVENFENTMHDRPGVLMTIGEIQDHQKIDYSEQRDYEDGSMSRGSSHVNIRSDERMPARGELSGQESMGGNSDITWNRLQYQEGSSRMSHYYEMIGRESWEASDSESVDNPSIKKQNATQVSNEHGDYDDNDMPTIIGYSGPPRNFKCSTCGDAFVSSKERKEHELEKHPEKAKCNFIGSEVGKKTVKKLVIRTKTEKTKTEPNFDNLFANKLKVENQNEVQNEAIAMEATVKLDETVEIRKINKYICNLCNCVLDSAKSLRLHRVEIHNEILPIKHKCLTCGEVFPNEYKYTDHLKVHPLECRLCGKLFFRRQNIRLHMKRHLGLKPYKCDICDKAFVTRQKLEEHKNVHTGDAPIKCNLCDEKFRRYSNLVQHKNRHHFQIKKKIKDYICQCGEIFHSKKKLAWHKEVHESKPKACSQCSEKFLHMSSLTRHMRRAHNEKFLPQENRQSENVECPICKGTYLRSSLEVHIKNHSGTRPYSCLMCSKDFTTKWNLKLHKWTHASRNSKPFKCDQCKGAFIRESDYTAHMNSHKSVRPYTCNYCGAQFIRKYNCLRHVKEHENDKTFNCNVCGKTFHRSYYLKDHMRVHSGVRPYTCHICGKTSTTKSNHNKHVQIHHAREPVSTEN